MRPGKRKAAFAARASIGDVHRKEAESDSNGVPNTHREPRDIFYVVLSSSKKHSSSFSTSPPHKKRVVDNGHNEVEEPEGEEEHHTVRVAKKRRPATAVAASANDENNENTRLEKLSDFVFTCDPSHAAELLHSQVDDDLLVIGLAQDKFKDDFVESLKRSAIVEVASLPGGCELRREFVECGAESNKLRLTQSLFDAVSSEGGDDDDEESDEDVPLQKHFQFDVTRVNRPLTFLFNCILIDALEKKDLRDALRRVRKDDNHCYSRGVGSFLEHSSDTVLEAINKLLEPFGAMLFRIQIYDGGLCAWHQDYGAREDCFMLKIGREGFLQMKRTTTILNKAFLGVECDEGALGIDPSEAFVQVVENNVCHTGGGDASATLMFRSIDGAKMTQQQKDGIMACTCALDCHLEASMTETRSTKELLTLLDLRSLTEWKVDDATKDETHFMFMAKHVLARGPEWLQATTVDVLNAIYVHSPTLGRKVSVGSFLIAKLDLLMTCGKAAFTEEQYEILSKIGLRENLHRAPTMLHFKNLLEYKNQGGDVNALERKHGLVKETDGKMKIEEFAVKKGGWVNTGNWIYQKIMDQRRGYRTNRSTKWVFKELGLDWNRQYENKVGGHYYTKVEDQNMQLLRAFKEQGGDINALVKADDLEEPADGTIQVVKQTGKVRDDAVGCWLGTNRRNWKKGQKSGARWDCISKERVEMLEELGINWEVDLSKIKYPQVTKNPHYQILLSYFEDDNDVNVLNTSQNLVKTEDGWEIVVAPTEAEKKKSTGAWLRNQKIEERRGKLASDRKEVLSAIGVEWLPPASP